MPANARHRFDPTTGLYNYGTISNEEQTVGLIEELGLYGFYLEEAPRIQSIGSSLVIVEDVTGGATWTEQTPNAPDAGSFWLDRRYDSGFVRFNQADDGKNFLVSYQGKGGLASVENFPKVIPEAIQASGDINIVGDLSVSETLSITGSSTFTGGFKTEGSDLFRVKKIDIGPWDMDTDPGVSIVIGLTDAQCSKIVEMQAIVFDDSGKRIRRISTVYDATGLASGNITVFLDPFAGGPDAVASITRVTGGIFDSTDYNDAVINRGYIYIVYMV